MANDFSSQYVIRVGKVKGQGEYIYETGWYPYTDTKFVTHPSQYEARRFENYKEAFEYRKNHKIKGRIVRLLKTKQRILRQEAAAYREVVLILETLTRLTGSSDDFLVAIKNLQSELRHKADAIWPLRAKRVRK